MCTYSTEKVALARSSGKTREGWATLLAFFATHLAG